MSYAILWLISGNLQVSKYVWVGLSFLNGDLHFAILFPLSNLQIHHTWPIHPISWSSPNGGHTKRIIVCERAIFNSRGRNTTTTWYQYSEHHEEIFLNGKSSTCLRNILCFAFLWVDEYRYIIRNTAIVLYFMWIPVFTDDVHICTVPEHERKGLWNNMMDHCFSLRHPNHSITPQQDTLVYRIRW